MMTRLIVAALLLTTQAHAALRPGTGPTMPAPTPDTPVTSWQPPFLILR